MAYPVSVDVVPVVAARNRLTTAFRLILAIPHLILAGGVGLGLAVQNERRVSLGSEGGLLGVVAVFMAIVSWFSIVFTGTHIAGIRQFTAFYLRWRVRALAYVTLLEDAYPPFGDAPYPASLTLIDPALPRNRLTVGVRLLLVIPHAIVLFFIALGWGLATVAAWFAILFTGHHPRGLYDFGVGALRWMMRVQTYALLMVDEYPPFSLQ